MEIFWKIFKEQKALGYIIFVNHIDKLEFMMTNKNFWNFLINAELILKFWHNIDITKKLF